jgi:MoaD family protein
VREALVDRLRRRLGGRGFDVFNVKNRDDREAILKRLSEARTIRITVKFFGPFRDVFGGREMELDLPPDGPLRELLTRISDTPKRRRELFAGTNVLQPQVVVMQNGVPIQGPGGLDHRLQSGDVIAIFPFLGGG